MKSQVSPGTLRARPRDRIEHLMMVRMGQAIADHGLIKAGDRVLVAVSGGKKSLALLYLLDLARRRYSFSFALYPLFVDRGGGPALSQRVKEIVASFGFRVQVVETDLPNSNQKIRHRCRACCAMKYKILEREARKRECTRVALGHHLDDLVETLLMNLFFSGRIKTLQPKLPWNQGGGDFIKPLLYVEDTYFEHFLRLHNTNEIAVDCPCRFGQNDIKRKTIRRMLEEMVILNPKIHRTILAAVKHIRTSHLLMDNPPAYHDREKHT